LVRNKDHDPAFVEAVENLLDFYNWCRKCRNIILHSERYPPAFGGKRDELYMIKWTKEQPRKAQYVRFTVAKLRGIADNIRAAVVQSAEINMHMRYRGIPLEKVPGQYKPYAPKPPHLLKIPKPLETSDKP
jgi:hypothetical protein